MNNISNVDLELLKEKYQGESLDIALNKIKEGYPVQYLIGNVNFFGNLIGVNEDVLIPRFETEFLVDLALKTLPGDYSGNILDIGTGSGCIAISIAKKLVNSTVEGIDISKNALDVAIRNKNNNNVSNLKFTNKDIFEINNFDEYDVIISNPPYVSHDEVVGIETKYEPQNAIFADDNGLKYYEHIIKSVSRSKNVKHVFFEIGMNQAESISKIKEVYLPNYSLDVFKDLAKKDRYIHIYLNK